MKTKAKTKTKKVRKPPTRRLSVYNAMEKALRKEGFLKPGVLGSYLIDKFLSKDHYIVAADALENGFYKDKKNAFSDWRQLLVDGEWLIYDDKKNLVENTHGKCSPGKRLNGYLNKEKFKHEEVVTSTMLNNSLEKKADTEQLVLLQTSMDRLLEVMITKYMPPFTKEKLEACKGDIDPLIKAAEECDDERPVAHPDYAAFLKN